MFKKSVCWLLALLLSVSLCACARQVKAETGASAAASQSTTAASEENQNAQKKKQTKTTADKNKKKQKTTESKKKTTASESSGKTTQKQESTSKAQAPDTSKKPGKQTTKAPTTKQPTTKKKPAKNTVEATFTIDCSQALGEVEGLPSSGYYFKSVQVSVKKGASVYDALCKCCESRDVSVVASNTMYGMYVSAIGGLAEKQVGKTSGWTYTVNGKYPPKSCDKYTMEDGDKVEFIYKAG
ncbi:MAG: DUF4430 domain-containing protein [Clostridia bacterium]|nr:DUF4430 domain-containing protein [Clostridia bacterium]